MIEWTLVPLVFFLGYFWVRKRPPKNTPPETLPPTPQKEVSLLEIWPWPAALVDEKRNVQALTPSFKIWFPSPEPSHLLELPFPGLVEFHERLFSEGEARLEFEAKGGWWRLEGKRIRPDLSTVRLLEITREKELSLRNQLLVATLGHEFRTPLTALQGYAETLEEFLPPEELPQKALSGLKENLGELTRLVSDLLFFSSLERVKAVEEPVELKTLVQGAQRLVGSLLEKKALRLELSGPEGLFILGDPEYLRRALIKVLENALRFSPEGGTIRLEWGKEGEEVFLRVIDQGPGVPEEIRERIFEPFFRAGPGRGLGLGLALARILVEIHGGTLALEPSARGAVFVFRWPVARISFSEA